MNANRVCKLLLAGLFATAAFGSAVISAQEDFEEDGNQPPSQERMGGRPGGMGMDDTGLSDELAAQVKKIKSDCQAKMKPLLKELRAKKTAITDELKKEEYSADAARKLQAEAKTVEAKISDLKTEELISLRAALPAQDFAKAAKTMQGGMRGGGNGMRGGRGGKHGSRSDGSAGQTGE
ncbi:MAG: periplasmic heavy metal sensor [Elusimicrobiaceae bacterium]|nr:periplasmic heavy metal sensor [Elusimicrobiaceae bacterium]